MASSLVSSTLGIMTMLESLACKHASSKTERCGKSKAGTGMFFPVSAKADQTTVSSVPACPRRVLVASTAAAAMVLLCAADASPAHAAARRKPAPKVEKKDDDTKDLSAYQAKLVESSKRKEAMKAAVAERKSKAGPAKATPADVTSAEQVVTAEPEAVSAS